MNKKGSEDSLCKIFNPKCFKTTNFDRFPWIPSRNECSKFSCQISNSDYAMFWLYVSYLSGFKNALLLSCLDKNEKCLSKGRYQIAKFAMRGEDLLRALLDVSAENILDTYCPRNILQKTLFVESKNIQNAKY